MQSDCSNLRRFLGSVNPDKELIEKALTHPSVTSDSNRPHCECYERLEFLGDAVLKLISSEYLYEKFPDFKEGQLSAIRSFIVSDENLASVAEKINLIEEIKVSQTDKTLCKNESVAACALEALLGALYLSGKMKELKEFFEYNFSQTIDDIAQNKLIINPKAILQEYTQGDSKSLPEYKIISEKGAAHDKTFEIQVTYKDEILGSGTGKTKKAAQQDAALKAAQKLGLIN